jgi:DNA invertase Pin-like site-specific DNA recombinase
MRELLRLIESPDIHGVVAREFSRLMRPENLGDFSLLQAFADTNTLLFLPDGPIDFSAKTGRLLGTIRAAIAGLEKSEFLERSFASREEMRRQGKCPSAPHTRPYATGYEDGRGWFYLPDVEKVRRAFELVLSGETNFGELERETGLSRDNLRNILKNPIYTGWRVYDKKRDGSKAGLYASTDGRQSGRRKIARPPEEVIRVKVIDEPIISDADFARVQALLESKCERHIRARHTNGSRFTYHGFLSCSLCGGTEYGKTYKNHGGLWDYYGCSNRTKLELPRDARCKTPIMRRDRLEQHLDVLFSTRLTDPGFIRELAEELEQRQKGTASSRSQVDRLREQLANLEAKRRRILDGYFEGVISHAERDARMIAVDRDRQIADASLEAAVPTHDPISPEQLVEYFRPLFTWEFLKAEAKRRILFSLIPEIRVANYIVSGLGILAPVGDEGATQGIRKVSQSAPADPGSFKRPAASVALEQDRQTVGYYVNRHTTGHLIADRSSSRIFIPLSH